MTARAVPPTATRAVKHVTVAAALAILLLNQVLILDALAPGELESHSGAQWTAFGAITVYGLLPYLDMAGTVALRAAARLYDRRVGGDAA